MVGFEPETFEFLYTYLPTYYLPTKQTLNNYAIYYFYIPKFVFSDIIFIPAYL